MSAQEKADNKKFEETVKKAKEWVATCPDPPKNEGATSVIPRKVTNLFARMTEEQREELIENEPKLATAIVAYADKMEKRKTSTKVVAKVEKLSKNCTWHPFFLFIFGVVQRHPFFLFIFGVFQRHPFFLFIFGVFQRH